MSRQTNSQVEGAVDESTEGNPVSGRGQVIGTEKRKKSAVGFTVFFSLLFSSFFSSFFLFGRPQSVRSHSKMKKMNLGRGGVPLVSEIAAPAPAGTPAYLIPKNVQKTP